MKKLSGETVYPPIIFPAERSVEVGKDYGARATIRVSARRILEGEGRRGREEFVKLSRFGGKEISAMNLIETETGFHCQPSPTSTWDGPKFELRTKTIRNDMGLFVVDADHLGRGRWHTRETDRHRQGDQRTGRVKEVLNQRKHSCTSDMQ